MTDMSVSAARSRPADVIDDARVHHAPVFLTRRAAAIGAEDLEHLSRAAEDLATLRPHMLPVRRPPSAEPCLGTRSRLASGWCEPLNATLSRTGWSTLRC